MPPTRKPGWSLVPVRKMTSAPGGVVELHVVWRGKRGLSMLTKTQRESKSKALFGPIASMNYEPAASSKKGEVLRGFNMENRKGERILVILILIGIRQKWLP